MNTAIDINSSPVRFAYLDPDQPDDSEAKEAAANDYIGMWQNDELADSAYEDALQQLTTEHSDLFLEGLADYRKGDVDEFYASAGRFFRQLEKIVREQAA